MHRWFHVQLDQKILDGLYSWVFFCNQVYVQMLVCQNRKDVLWIVEILLEDCNFLSHWLCRRTVYKQVQWWSFYLFSKIVFWKNPSMKIQTQLQIFIGPNLPKRLAIHVFHVPLCIRHWWSRYYWLHIELGLPSLHYLVAKMNWKWTFI